MRKVSCVVIAFNEADKIEAALRSVQWADEIVLVDSGSTDDTAVIAERLGARVVQVPFEGFGRLRTSSIAAATHEWIFTLDADERCTAEARDAILDILARPDEPHEAYRVPRRNYFMGRWIKGSGWYPDFRQPQLFKRGAILYSTEPVHESYTLASSKPLGTLTADIHQVPFRSLGEILRKADRYSTLGAQKLAERGKTPGFGTALGHGLWSFLRHYVFKGGFRDGWAGFVIALGNFEGTFYRYAKRAEARAGWTTPPAVTLDRPERFN